MSPLFSIITITFNAEQVLPATLESVRSQKFTDFEYLIADGASTDGTVALAEKSGIAGMSIVSEPDKGLYDAMNKGIARARGSYLIFSMPATRSTRPCRCRRLPMPSAARAIPTSFTGRRRL